MTRPFLPSIILAALSLSCAAFVNAHHSLGATYDTDETVELQGTVVQFLFRNPHSFLHIEAPDENGEIQRWSLEWRDAGTLRQQGFGRSVLKIGDEVTVTMHPTRSTSDHRGALLTLRRESDGLGWGDDPDEVVR